MEHLGEKMIALAFCILVYIGIGHFLASLIPRSNFLTSYLWLFFWPFLLLIEILIVVAMLVSVTAIMAFDGFEFFLNSLKRIFKFWIKSDTKAK